MRKISLLIVIICISIIASKAQTLSGKVEYKKTEISFPLKQSTNVSSINEDWQLHFRNLEPPSIGNNAYRAMLASYKQKVAEKYPRDANKATNTNITFTTDTPIVWRNFEGNTFLNSVPNDNTLAISNGGKLVSAINTNIFFYDIEADSLEATVSLSAFSGSLGLNPFQYDPKLLYDPSEDRFILVFLAGSKDTTSNIIVAFSSSNDPTQNWNLYFLPGNPLLDSSWSDYPAIAITEDELFLTINLLKNDGSWQTAFKQTLVWQINKFDGYSGQPLSSLLWTDITYNGENLRNIHPVKGGSQLYGPDIYLMSNKNFSLSCDSIYLIHIDGSFSKRSPDINIQLLHSDINYGMPPTARQFGIHTFETNDARVLGAFLENGKIQFVFNTVNPANGFAAVYHGIIDDVGGSNTIKGNIISDTELDFGYPNISYAGEGINDNKSLISFNHTSPNEYAGFSALYYNGINEYSQPVKIIRGETYVNVITGAYERWGDYSGSQRKYNEPGKVWVAGSFGKKEMNGPFTNRLNGTWIAELEKPYGLGIQKHPTDNKTKVFPLPAIDIVYVDIELEQQKNISLVIFDDNGRLVKELFKTHANKGKNHFSFSTYPLKSGKYYLQIIDTNGVLLHRQQIIVIR